MRSRQETIMRILSQHGDMSAAQVRHKLCEEADDQLPMECVYESLVSLEGQGRARVVVIRDKVSGTSMSGAWGACEREATV